MKLPLQPKTRHLIGTVWNALACVGLLLAAYTFAFGTPTRVDFVFTSIIYLGLSFHCFLDAYMSRLDYRIERLRRLK